MSEANGYRLAIQAAYNERFGLAAEADASDPVSLARLFALFDPHRPLTRIFDAGCGAGALSIFLARRHVNAEVLGRDFSEVAVERARTLAQADGATRVRFEVGEATDAPRGTDLVVANAVFNLLEDKRAALAAWSDALAPQGEIRIGDGFLSSSGRVPNGPGPVNIGTLQAMARDAHLTVDGWADATNLVRDLASRGHWRWTEYVRTGDALRFVIVTMRRAN